MQWHVTEAKTISPWTCCMQLIGAYYIILHTRKIRPTISMKKRHVIYAYFLHGSHTKYIFIFKYTQICCLYMCIYIYIYVFNINICVYLSVCVFIYVYMYLRILHVLCVVIRYNLYMLYVICIMFFQIIYVCVDASVFAYVCVYCFK